MSRLKTGAASVAVALGEDCFPNAETVGLHDDVYVRVIIFETDRRYAILSADMPSMFPPDVRWCKQLLEQRAGVKPEDSWITVTHSFSAPHTWPIDDSKEQKDTPFPPNLRQGPVMVAAALKINKAYRDAYESAVTQAVSGMREAKVGFAYGKCGININRNMYTVDGWWQGVNADLFADRTVSVVRFDDLNDNPIAVIYNYSVQTSSTQGAYNEAGDKLVSADLTGYASCMLEREYEGCTALFLCGATGDQVPIYKMNYYETDKEGKLRTGRLGERAYLLMEEQGRILAGSVMEAMRSITDCADTPEIRTQRCSYICQCQKRDVNMENMRPSKEFTFHPNGEREMSIDAMIIGEIAMVGLLPEMDGITVAEIREASPYKNTLVACYVNGNAKTMPQAAAYPVFQYTAMNSPFVQGSAELTRDTAVGLLESIYNN